MTPGKDGLQLVIEGSENNAFLVPLGGQYVVGSDPSRAGIFIDDTDLAGEHFSIGRLVKGGWALRDLGSELGTRINGQPVKSKRIQHGDRIEIGSLTLRVLDLSIEAMPNKQANESSARPSPKEPEEIVLEPAPKPRVSSTKVPKQIGGYRIERMLGRGAFGNVLLAVQESLQRETALKLLSPALAENRTFVARFQEEARAAASLAHPNVVIVYDVGEAQGYHFLSMEYMSLGSLEGRLRKEGKLAWPDVLAIMTDATRGLVYAEQRGIVHRDIKPANLMQTDGGVTKISDLGLAVSLDAATNKEALGTAHFVSPEQARGEKVDHRSDLYSLGATAFQLLTGRTPFEGPTKGAILKAVFNTEAPPVSEFVADVPDGLTDLISRLLAKLPEDRPGTARQLLFDLDQLAARSTHSAASDDINESSGIVAKSVIGLAVIAALIFALNKFGAAPESTDSDEAKTIAAEKTITAPPEFDTVDSEPSASNDRTTFDPPIEDVVADDQALNTLEQQASSALQNVSALSTLDERVKGLRSVELEFSGTNAAREAKRQLAEIDKLESQLDAETRRQAGERDTALLVLKEFIRSETEQSSVITALFRIQKYQRPVQFQGDDQFGEQLVTLRDELIASALANVEASLVQTDQLIETGQFDLATSELESQRTRLGIASYQSSLEPGSDQPLELALDLTASQLAPLLDADQKLVARGLSLADEQLNWGAKLAERDLSTRNLELLANGGLENELATLDFGAAQSRLSTLLSHLQTEQRKAEIAALIEGLRTFELALLNLATEFKAGNWRRTTISDPRSGSTKKREVVGTEKTGWLLAGASRPELLPHSVVMRSTSTLERLFNARLNREYTPDELSGIAFGLQVAAVLETLDRLEPIFNSSSPSLQEKHLDQFLSPFVIAEKWATTAGSTVSVQSEQIAVRRVALALIDAGNEAWTSAVSELDSANELAANSLLLLLIP